MFDDVVSSLNIPISKEKLYQLRSITAAAKTYYICYLQDF